MKNSIRTHSFNWIALSGLLLLLQGCGGGTGADVVSQPNTNIPVDETYNGPPPATDDVQRFKLNVWDNLVPQNRCGACHSTGGQEPTFVQLDDINLAYGQSNTVVDLTTPSQSIMVTKVAGGHNCWLESDAACADTITRYIEGWAGDSSNNTNTIELRAPAIKEPGQSKSFPDEPTSFAGDLHTLLTTYCSECHTEAAAIPQSPYFAAADVNVAYQEVRSKIDLDTPSNSRLVLRLRGEFHNCWSDCGSNANELETAISAFSDTIVPTTIDPNLVVSKALNLTDGILANSGGRHEENVIALYEFKTGQGTTAFDTSGVEPALNLTLSGDVEWVGGWGVKINDGKAQGTTDNSKKLRNQILATGEYSIEAWVVPGNVTQNGPARIISYSGGTTARNFTLGQTLYSYNFLNRSSVTNGNGEAALSTRDADEDLQATLQHVVATYSPSNGRRIYVNGQFTGDIDTVGGGTLNEWDDTFAFVLGNEVSSDRLWQGTLRFVAVHSRALTEEQIQQNFDVGVGENFFLLFSTTHLANVPEGYIVFEVSRFDNYSYLFSSPFYISLDGNSAPDNITLKGLRLGLNGKLLDVGQAFANLDTVLGGSAYDTNSGQSLSELGTIIPLEKGPDSDEFFLSFEQFGENTNVILDATPAPTTPTVVNREVSDIGLKTFEEINATMSAITGVNRASVNVKATFETVKQQLPTAVAVDGFLSAHQMAVTQLAIEYCDSLVDDAALRAAFFPSVNVNDSVAIAFSESGRNNVINPLLDRALGNNLLSQPEFAEVSSELNSLIDTLTSCGAGCESNRTATVIKATCAAVLGSATTLIQ